MKVLKTIVHGSYSDRILTETILGIFESDKIESALDKIKKDYIESGLKLISDKKDCCDYEIIFEDEEEIESDRNIVISTKGYILNELV